MKEAPHNIEAEMAVLGSVFVDNACLRKVTNLIDATDFFAEKHRKIFHSFLSLQIKAAPLDFVTVIKALHDAGTLADIGGGDYVASLVEYTPTAANVAYYCRIVRELSLRRKMLEQARTLTDMAHDSTVSVSDAIEAAKDGFREIASGLDGFAGVKASDILSLDDRVGLYVEHARQYTDNRFMTGFPELDHYIRGVAPGEVMQIVAYSGTFKTAFLQNLLLAGARRTGQYHLFFSLEMPAAKVFEREAQISTGWTGREVESVCVAKDSGKESMLDAMYAAGSKGLLVCDRPRMNLEKIGRYIELSRDKYGSIKVVGIDYMGLMDAPGKSLFDKTAYIAAETKNLAKEMGLPIIMLCQINRDSAKNQKEIEMHSAKGGGDIEAGADFMLGFYIDGEKLICKLLKNRNGPAGKRFEVDIKRECFRFDDMKEVAYQKEQTEKRKAV